MKKLILSLLLLSWLQPAGANPKSHWNENLSELALEEEAEELEVYDQQAMEQQALQEAKDLEKQARSMEKDISRLKRQSKNSEQKLTRLQKRYDQSAKVANRTEKEANAAQAQYDKVSARVAKLQSQVDNVENRAVEARNKRIKLNADNRKAEREIRVLTARKNEAQKIIVQNESKIKTLQKKNRELLRRQTQLQNDVNKKNARIESQRQRMASSNF